MGPVGWAGFDRDGALGASSAYRTVSGAVASPPLAAEMKLI